MHGNAFRRYCQIAAICHDRSCQHVTDKEKPPAVRPRARSTATNVAVASRTHGDDVAACLAALNNRLHASAPGRQRRGLLVGPCVALIDADDPAT
jgi:hypothetical protein